MRQALEAACERIEDRLVPEVHQRSESARSSALRISGTGAAASITRMRCGSARALEVRGAHALENAILALEAIERLSRSRRLETSNEQSKTSVRSGRGRMRRGREPLDQVAGHALPRSLVRGGRVGKAVADHPRPGLERGRITRATWSARAAKRSSVSTSGVIGLGRIASRSRSARSVPPGSRVWMMAPAWRRSRRRTSGEWTCPPRPRLPM